jgi:hypothetical protein
MRKPRGNEGNEEGQKRRFVSISRFRPVSNVLEKIVFRFLSFPVSSLYVQNRKRPPQTRAFPPDLREPTVLNCSLAHFDTVPWLRPFLRDVLGTGQPVLDPLGILPIANPRPLCRRERAFWQYGDSGDPRRKSPRRSSREGDSLPVREILLFSNFARVEI